MKIRTAIEIGIGIGIMLITVGVLILNLRLASAREYVVLYCPPTITLDHQTISLSSMEYKVGHLELPVSSCDYYNGKEIKSVPLFQQGYKLGGGWHLGY